MNPVSRYWAAHRHEHDPNDVVISVGIGMGNFAFLTLVAYAHAAPVTEASLVAWTFLSGVGAGLHYAIGHLSRDGRRHRPPTRRSLGRGDHEPY